MEKGCQAEARLFTNVGPLVCHHWSPGHQVSRHVMMMDVSLENFHIYILISRHATDTDMGPILSTLSLFIRTFTKYANQGGASGISSTLRLLLFSQKLENIIYHSILSITLIFVLYLFGGETLPFQALKPPKPPFMLYFFQ